MLSLFAFSCKGVKKAPVDLSEVVETGAQSAFEVPYREMNSLKVIPVKLNGVSTDMIIDTGCSGISLSLHELETMIKNGMFTQDDVIGTSYASIADGSIVETGVIRLSRLEIGGPEGIVLHDMEASVALNQMAPVLLGNDVLDRVASFEVDNVKKIVKFTKH